MVSIAICYEGADEVGRHTFIVRGIEGLTFSFVVANYAEFQDKVIDTIEKVIVFCGLPEDGANLLVLIDFIPE